MSTPFDSIPFVYDMPDVPSTICRQRIVTLSNYYSTKLLLPSCKIYMRFFRMCQWSIIRQSYRKTWHEWSNVSKSIFFTKFFLFSKTRFSSKSGNKFSTISCLHVEKLLETCFRVHPWLTLQQNQCLEITLKVFF